MLAFKKSYKKPYLLAAVGAALLAVGCQDTDTKKAVAFYAYSDGHSSETVALRLDGKYVQSETQHGDNPISATDPIPNTPSSFEGMTLKQTGIWRLLDGPGGKPLSLPTSAASLPPQAVVELHKPLPFGVVWGKGGGALAMVGTRTLPANEFKIQR